MPHRIRSLFTALLLISASVSPGHAQSEMEQRNTSVVQDVYLRTLSVSPSTTLVRDAQTAFDLAVRSYGPTDGRTADMAVNLGRALNGSGQNEAAVPLLESALSIYDDLGNAAQLRHAVAHYQLGLAHSGTGDTQSAITALTQAYAIFEPNLRRLSANSAFIRRALQAAGCAEAVQKAEAEAATKTPPSSTQPKVKLKIPPIFPPDESEASTGGWVLLDYRLWPDGSVRDVYVLAADPESVFDISAAMALLQWRFESPHDPAEHFQLSVAFNTQ